MSKDVVIVGGGIAGLAAAWELEQLGEVIGDVTLVEASNRLGGKMVSERVDGYLIEGGPDSFVTNKEPFMQFLERLGVLSEVVSTQASGSSVWSRGRLEPLPEGLVLMIPSKMGPFLRSHLVSWPGKLRMLADLVIPRRRQAGDESLSSFVTRRLGREALERIAEPLIGGIHGAPPDRMSIEAAFPRFPQMEREHGSLIRAALAGRRTMEPPRPGARFSYFASFREGMGQLPAEIARRLQRTQVMTGYSAATIRRGERYQVLLANGATLEADAVILATPPHVSSRLVGELDERLAGLVATIPQSATATVSVAYPRAAVPPLRGSGFVVPAVEHRRIMGLTYMSAKFPLRTPDESTVLLRAFIGGEEGQELVSAPKEEILAAVRAELRAILRIEAEPLLTRVHTWRYGLPQYVLGHLDRVRQIEERVARWPGLQLAGAAYHGIGVPDCVESGLVAARTIAATAGR